MRRFSTSGRLACAAFATLLPLALQSHARAAGTVVQTALGAVQGLQVGTVTEFRGIPYAAPPVGALRWKPPQPAAPWQGVRDGTVYGSACPQGGQPGVPLDEDCLTLNVTRPGGGGTNLPVMFWIHGGAYVTGAGSLYDGAALASAGNVVVVTINYRLGFLGFLAHPALSAESPDHASGDYGLMDQQAALRWVRANIGAFGGNPGNVTIFGESAGGQSVIDQLASPTAANLFSRAIIESGGYAVRLPTLSEAEANGTASATKLGCTGSGTAAAACLRAVAAADLVALENTGAAVSGLTAFEPDTGPALLPFQPTLAIGTGFYNHVPVLQGSNHDEARLFVAGEDDFQGNPITAATYMAAIESVVGTLVAPVVQALYPLAAYPSPDIAFSTLFTDAGFPCSAAALDEALTASVPTYAYEFADENAARLVVPPDPYMNVGASHASELPFLWPSTQAYGQFTAAERTLSAQMMAAWTNFARNGSPNGGAAAGWTRYVPASGNVLELVPGGNRTNTGFKQDHKCWFWQPLLGIQAVVPASAIGR